MKPKTYTIRFDIHLPATATEPERFLKTITVEVFHNFGEEILTPESSAKIERIKARHLGIMTGADIKAMRERLGLSQKELTDLLDCGDKTLSRWENGHGYPTGANNKLLRLLDENFLAPASLEAVKGPRSELSTERFLRNRAPNVVHYDFANLHLPSGQSSRSEDELALASSS